MKELFTEMLKRGLISQEGTKPYHLDLMELYKMQYVYEHRAGAGVLNFAIWFSIPEANKEN